MGIFISENAKPYILARSNIAQEHLGADRGVGKPDN